MNNLASSEWNPNLAVPLVHSNMNLGDMIEQYDSSGMIQVGEDNFITIVYGQHLLTYKVDEFVNIPDQNLERKLNLTAQETIDLATNGNVSSVTTDIIPFAVSGDEQINSMHIKSGTINVSVSSEFLHSGMITVSFPTVTNGAVTLSKTFSLNYTGSGPVQVSGSADLTDYTLNLSNGSQGFGELPVVYTLTLNNSGNPVTTLESITVNHQMQNLKFDALFGNLGQKSIDIPADTLKLDFFSNSIGGQFSLVDPRLKLTVSNSFGLPIRGVFNQFSAQNNLGSAINISGNDINPLNINSPSVNEVGQSASTLITLNNTNSNIAAVINSQPSKIIYNIQGITNPDGNSASNFITDQSQVDIDLEMELPLNGSAFDFVIQDTMDFTFPYEIEKIQEALFRLNIENGFPVEAKVQVYFTDENLNILDSLINTGQQVISSGAVNNNGRITEPNRVITDIHFPEEKINNLYGTKKVIVTGTLSTSNTGSVPVKIYADYSMDVRLGMQATLKVGL